nr:MAG TPA: hypothetical protein [Caudoviricetes sp.]
MNNSTQALSRDSGGVIRSRGFCIPTSPTL